MTWEMRPVQTEMHCLNDIVDTLGKDIKINFTCARQTECLGFP